MGRFLSRHVTTMVVAMVTAAVTAGGPALAHGVRHALFAHNADKVDGKHAVNAGASLASRAGKLVATGRTGRLPNNIITKAPDADKLDGINSTGFLRAGGKAADADKLDGLDSTALSTKHFFDESGATTPFAASFACTSYAGLEVVVNAPGPGTVEVSGTTQLRLVHTNGALTRAVAIVGATPTECADNPGAGRVDLASGMPTGTYFDTVGVTRTFTIPEAGTYNYYLTGVGSTHAAFWFARLNATFFPAN